MRNIEGHRIDGHGLLISGGDLGGLAMLAAGVIPMLLTPLLTDGADVWTSWKVMSTPLLGESAAVPATGFELLPIVAGIIVLALVGSAMGALFTFLVGFADIDGITATVVSIACVLAVFPFAFVWVPMSETFLPALSLVPIPAAGAMFIVFGLLMGFGEEGWRSRWDHSVHPHAGGVRGIWLLELHQRALAATTAMFVLLVLIVAVSAETVNWAVAILLLAAVGAVAVIAAREASRARSGDLGSPSGTPLSGAA
jgi:hypothetical protein